MKTTIALTTLTLGSALVLAGCASTAADSAPEPLESASQQAVSAEPTPVEPAPDLTQGISVDDLGIDISQGAPAPGTDAAIAWEALMSVEGEYAAAASYQAVIDTYGNVEPYTTILEAELRHVNALVNQLQRMGVAVPANPYLGKLVAPASLTDAALAWAEGEVHNVAMYDSLISQSSDSRLSRVLGNLRRVSLEVHLPLFEKASANGGTLAAEQMTH